MHAVLERIYLSGILPVLANPDAHDALCLARALSAEGGVSCLEIAVPGGAGAHAVALVAAEAPDLLVGAGEISTVEEAGRAVKAGARFLSCSGCDGEIIRFARENSVVVLPGCVSAEDVERSAEFGAEAVCLFPSRQPDVWRAFCDGRPDMPVVLGDVGADFVEYLAMEKVIACECAWLPGEGEIALRVRGAMERMLRFGVEHIGINTPCAESAERAARRFQNLFGFPVREAPRSYFAGTGIETLKEPYMAERGHIAINCSNVDRAMAYLKNRGNLFREETIKRGPSGAATSAYLKDEVEGFAIHLRPAP